jgi:cytochrome c oxidase cbb3-type subunit 3
MTRVKAAAPFAILAATLLAAAPAWAEETGEIKTYTHIYDTYCAQCHGLNRNGKGVNTVALSVQPRDHSDPKGMSSLPREEMLSAIRNGGASVNKSSLMPPWSSVLTDDQIEHMVDYLHYVCHCGTSNNPSN